MYINTNLRASEGLILGRGWEYLRRWEGMRGNRSFREPERELEESVRELRGWERTPKWLHRQQGGS